MIILQDLIQCIRDTHKYVSPKAANQMRAWLQYPTNKLVTMIQISIRRPHSKDHCLQMRSHGGMAVEDFVVKHSDLFTAEDKQIAIQNLDVKQS